MRCLCWSIIFFFLLCLFFTHYITAPPDESVGVSSFIRFLLYIFIQTLTKIGGDKSGKGLDNYDYEYDNGARNNDADVSARNAQVGATTAPPSSNPGHSGNKTVRSVEHSAMMTLVTTSLRKFKNRTAEVT